MEPPDKPRLVLIPGILCDETVFRHPIAALGTAWDVRVPMLDRYDSIPAMAHAVLDATPGAFALLGYSLGGRIAFEIVRQAPERVTHLAVLDTGVHPCRPDEPDRRLELVSLAFAKGLHAVVEAWLPQMVHPDRHDDAELMDTLAAMVERRTPESFRNQTMALIHRPDATPVLDSIRCPTLVLCGRDDAWSPLAQHEDIAARIRGARLAVIDHAGHFAPVERPAEVTNEVRSWLARGEP
jgi:pimeloyl-ACP methyl ester carboxylesterase